MNTPDIAQSPDTTQRNADGKHRRSRISAGSIETLLSPNEAVCAKRVGYGYMRIGGRYPSFVVLHHEYGSIEYNAKGASSAIGKFSETLTEQKLFLCNAQYQENIEDNTPESQRKHMLSGDLYSCLNL